MSNAKNTGEQSSAEKEPYNYFIWKSSCRIHLTGNGNRLKKLKLTINNYVGQLFNRKTFPVEPGWWYCQGTSVKCVFVFSFCCNFQIVPNHFFFSPQIYPSDHNSNNFSSAPSTPGSPHTIAGASYTDNPSFYYNESTHKHLDLFKKKKKKLLKLLSP